LTSFSIGSEVNPSILDPENPKVLDPRASAALRFWGKMEEYEIKVERRGVWRGRWQRSRGGRRSVGRSIWRGWRVGRERRRKSLEPRLRLEMMSKGKRKRPDGEGKGKEIVTADPDQTKEGGQGEKADVTVVKKEVDDKITSPDEEKGGNLEGATSPNAGEEAKECREMRRFWGIFRIIFHERS